MPLGSKSSLCLLAALVRLFGMLSGEGADTSLLRALVGGKGWVSAPWRGSTLSPALTAGSLVRFAQTLNQSSGFRHTAEAR